MSILTPFPHQLVGARFLAGRQHALLADEPRVGKTGTAILAADDNLESSILVVTTASGRAVWQRAFPAWSRFNRSVQVVTSAGPVTADAAIIGWPSIAKNEIRAPLLQRRWDRLILDESHYAKSFATLEGAPVHRTQAAYGTPIDDGETLLDAHALAGRAAGVWALSGTPVPHNPSDLYPMMRALCPQRLQADPARGWPDVTKANDFLHRYCQVRMKKLPRGWRKIPVVVGGKNGDELHARLEGFWLRRTQQDVGIRAPIHDLMPLAVTERMLRAAEGDLDQTTILKAAEAGDTKTLDMHLGPLRRNTGRIKVPAVIEAVRDEFDCGLDKVVLAYWHREVGDALADGLAKYGVLRLDGNTTATQRGPIEQEWLSNPAKRVFLAQIEAAGEAIDLSSAAVLWFVETVFSPRSMKQMSLRITNHAQARQALVRVCVMQGSIDEAVNQRLMMLWATIKDVLK